MLLGDIVMILNISSNLATTVTFMLFYTSEWKLVIRHFKHTWIRLRLMPDTRKLLYCTVISMYNHFKAVWCDLIIIHSRSKTIQNDIILCCGDHIRERVLSEVQKSKYYTILADEVVDIFQH